METKKNYMPIEAIQIGKMLDTGSGETIGHLVDEIRDSKPKRLYEVYVDRSGCTNVWLYIEKKGDEMKPKIAGLAQILGLRFNYTLEDCVQNTHDKAKKFALEYIKELNPRLEDLS